MGLFFETLKDINEKSEEGDFTKAKRILDQHIKAEHHFQSDLSGLQGALNAYSQELRELQEISAQQLERLGPSEEGFPYRKKALQELFKDKTYKARVQLGKIETLIMRLRKDAKIELR